MPSPPSPGLAPGPLPAAETPDYVVVELKPDSSVSLAGEPLAGRFVAPQGREGPADALNAILGAIPVVRVAPHLPVAEEALRLRLGPPPAGTAAAAEEFAKGGFVQVVPENPADCPALVRRLRRSPAVRTAFVAPRPVPAGHATSPNFEPTQGYLHSPPAGIGAAAVWDLPGAAGQGITVCDIEAGWNLTHEALPPNIPLLGGQPLPGQLWRDHGTAVLGVMVSRPKWAGTVGVCHKARAAVQSAVVNGLFNTAAAIVTAANQLRAGDVLLIELQAVGPTGRYVAMQYWDDVFLAIRVATRRGITVVEAAGNGGEDCDRAEFAATGLQRDAGAIVAGAGVPPTNWFDGRGVGGAPYGPIGPPRSRIWFSNYGRIVSLQGWGFHVATLGYGDAQGGADENAWYTLRFRGTSSAAPIVAGAVACLQGHARSVLGGPLPPRRIRSILRRCGMRQQAGPNAPLAQKIGPQPDLPRAVRLIRE